MTIETRYLPPTNHRGARIAVTQLCSHGAPRRVYVPWAYEHDTEPNHALALRHALDQWADAAVDNAAKSGLCDVTSDPIHTDARRQAYGGIWARTDWRGYHTDRGMVWVCLARGVALLDSINSR